MNNVPKRLKEKWSNEPPPRCARWQEGNCSGRMTKEHAFLYAGKQIQEEWSIINLCWFHHLGKGLNKRWNQRYAVSQATKEELAKYPRKSWSQYA